MCRRPGRSGSAQQAAPRVIRGTASPVPPWGARGALGSDLGPCGSLQVLVAYSLESGDFGISGAVKRAVGATVLARSHVQHHGFELVARLTGGRHCRPSPDPLLPRSRRPKVRGRKVLPEAFSLHSIQRMDSALDVLGRCCQGTWWGGEWDRIPPAKLGSMIDGYRVDSLGRRLRFG